MSNIGLHGMRKWPNQRLRRDSKVKEAYPYATWISNDYIYSQFARRWMQPGLPGGREKNVKLGNKKSLVNFTGV